MRDRLYLALSVVVQLALAVLFGHSYDQRIFMTTGYLVAHGRGPYSPLDLTGVFHHPGFARLTTIGYPPVWPLVTALAYAAAHALSAELLVYNLALKLPLIAATVGLAYLVAAVLRRAGAGEPAVRRARLFLLFNPLVLLTGAAWGQIDVVVALLAAAAVALLWRDRWASSAALLGLAVAIKPVAAPVLLAVVVWLAVTAPRRALAWAAVAAGVAAALALVPFAVFHWPVAQILAHPNAQFQMAGGLSWATVARLLHGTAALPGPWWLLGLLWIPALAVAAVFARRDPSRLGLVRAALALTTVFLLTRAWVAEPNVVLVLPFAVLLAALGGLDRRLLHALWVVPLAFAVADAAPLQLLWVAFPGSMDRALAVFSEWSTFWLALRAALVAAWQVAGWWTVVACLRLRGAEPRRHPNGSAAWT